MFERIRAAWRALWNSTTALPEPVEAVPAPRMRIANATLWEAQRHGSATFLPEAIFVRPQPMEGVLPAGMALDNLPQLNPVMTASYGQMASEGLGFLGFPYLAELSQRAEYRKIVSIWAEHCTRKWIKISGEETKVNAIEAEMKRLDVAALFRQAIEREGFFGRSHLFMDFGDFEKPEELRTQLVVDKAKISTKRPLQRLALIEPLWAYPGSYDAQNPLAPDFYRPVQWFVSGRVVHSSRLLTLVGHEMPNMLKPAYAFGGVSMTQLCKPYVDNWLRARQSSSDLLHAFSVMVLKTDMDQALTGGPAEGLWARLAIFNQMRDNRGIFAIDKNTEDFANISAPISGLDKMVAQAQEQMSSVSGIPLVVLLGITPSGLNASSEGEFRVFYDAILSYLTKVASPLLDTLLDVIQLSLFDEIDQDITFEFLSLWEMSDKDKSDIRKSDAEADVAYINAGVVSPEETRERLQNDETSMYHGVDLSGPAPEPPEDDLDPEDEQRLPFSQDEWSEQDHPRDEDGKFGSGGSVHDLDGSEVAPDDADQSQLRSAAKTYFDKHLRGLKVGSEALGQTVGFSTAGFKEARAWSAHPDKLRLFPAVPKVIEHGKLVRSDPPSSPRPGEAVRMFHTLEAPVSLRGEALTMQVVVREAVNGSFHYDHWANEHRKGPTASSPSPPNPKSGEQAKDGGAVRAAIGQFGDSINIGLFRGRRC